MLIITFPLFDLFADKFKSYGRFVQRYAVIVAKRFCHPRRNKRFYHRRVFRHSVIFRKSGQDIIEQQNTHLISRKCHEIALFVFECNAKTVGIGICTKHNVRVNFVGKIDPHGQRFFKFGVGHFYRGKFGIFRGLFFHDRRINTQLFQNRRNRLVTATVHGSIDEFKICSALFHRFFR